jgi:DNA-binding LytR/AlgR family response regulator
MNAAARGRRSISGSPKPRQGPADIDPPTRVLVLTRSPEALPRWLRSNRELVLSFAGSLDEVDVLLRSQSPQAVVVDRTFNQDRAQLLELLRSCVAHLLILGGESALGGRSPARPHLTRMPIKRGDEIALLPLREVASLEADGELVRLTTVRGERHTLSRPLKALEARLDASQFLRLSRGVLVNVNAIARLRVLARGGLSALLVNQAEFPISRSRAAQIRRRLVDL